MSILRCCSILNLPSWLIFFAAKLSSSLKVPVAEERFESNIHMALLWDFVLFQHGSLQRYWTTILKIYIFRGWKEITGTFWEIWECSFFFLLLWFMNLLILNRCVQLHTGKVWLAKSISVLNFFNASYMCMQNVASVWKVARILF